MLKGYFRKLNPLIYPDEEDQFLYFIILPTLKTEYDFSEKL